jgi:acyl-CoA synthetase (NDP forming)
MDLLDLSAAFSSLPLPKGRRVAVMTLGGGWGVVTADLCHEMGLKVPALTPEIIQRLDGILPPYWSRGNPIDLVGETDPTIPMRVMSELMAWDGCDAVINLGILGRKFGLDRMTSSTLKADPTIDPEFLKDIYKLLDQFEADYVRHLSQLMDQHQKPIVGVSLLSGAEEKTVFEVDSCSFNGVYFPTPERAVTALAEMCEYQRWLSRENFSG